MTNTDNDFNLDRFVNFYFVSAVECGGNIPRIETNRVYRVSEAFPMEMGNVEIRVVK